MKSATMIEPFCLGPKVKADTDGGRGAALGPVIHGGLPPLTGSTCLVSKPDQLNGRDRKGFPPQVDSPQI